MPLSRDDVLLGFVITHAIARPAYVTSEGLGDQLLTVSDCMTTFLPAPAWLGWPNAPAEERSAAISAFGLCDTDWPRLTELRESLEACGRLATPSLLRDMEAVRAVFDALPHVDPARVLAIGAHPDDVARCWSEKDAGLKVAAWVAERRPIPREADLLGYEVVGVEDTGQLHSFRCNSLLDVVRREGPVEMTPCGLFAEREVARAWADVFDREPLGEPVPWCAVSLSEVPLRLVR